MKYLLMLLLSAVAAFAQTNANSVDTNQPAVWVAPRTNKPPEEKRDAANVPVGSIPGVDSNVVTATLFWVVGQGEWQESGVMVDTAKGPAHVQKAIVASNLIASIVWKGKTNLTVLDSIPIREVGRTYYLESVKHFNQ